MDTNEPSGRAQAEAVQVRLQELLADPPPPLPEELGRRLRQLFGVKDPTLGRYQESGTGDAPRERGSGGSAT